MRRGQVVLVLLVLPVAVVLTIVAITLPIDSPPAPRLPSASSTSGVVAQSRATGTVALRIRTVGATAADLAALDATGLLVLANEPLSGGRSPVKVVYYDPARREAAEEVQGLLGRGTLVHEPVSAPESDITIMFGKDSTRT